MKKKVIRRRAGFTSQKGDSILATQPEMNEPRDIRPKNKHAIELLDAWLSEPDELGPEWWDEFEWEMNACRLSFR